MYIDFKETFLQLRALFNLCILKPNSWREILIGIIALVFIPLVILVCLISNIKEKGSD